MPMIRHCSSERPVKPPTFVRRRCQALSAAAGSASLVSLLSYRDSAKLSSSHFVNKSSKRRFASMSMVLQTPSHRCTCQITARQALPSRCRSAVCSASRQDPQPSGRRELFSLVGSTLVSLSALPALAAEELKVKSGQELKPENNKAKSDTPAPSPTGADSTARDSKQSLSMWAV